MRRTLLALLLVAAPLQAQTVTPANHIVWNEQGPDLPTVTAYR